MITKFKIFESVQDEIGFGMGADFANDMGEKFWGNIGAGIMMFSKKTKRFLIPLRSKYVNEPHTWGAGFGGKLDEEDGEVDFQDAAKRELIEETGYSGNIIRLIPVYIYKSKGFNYYNFIGVIEDEFEPKLDWENESYKWVNFEELIKIYPKHFGLKKLLEDEKTLKIIKHLSS